MKFRVGQRVRLLTDTGEGIITQLLDQNHVEVDLGDDFPLDVHVDELVPVDNQLSSFYSSESKEKQQDSLPKKMGQLFELSLAVVEGEAGAYNWYIINPEPIEILYVSYLKLKGKYRGVSRGQLPSGQVQLMGSIRPEDMHQLKGWYVQSLAFRAGKGHPQAAAVTQLDWNRSRLGEPSRYIEVLNEKGWIYSLRMEPTQLERNVAVSPPNVKATDQSPRPQKIVDLHLEALGPLARHLKSGDILPLQLKRAEDAFSNALHENCSSLILIHGVGEGKLKQAVKQLFEGNEHVRQIVPGDRSKFGSGATQIDFK